MQDPSLQLLCQCNNKYHIKVLSRSIEITTRLININPLTPTTMSKCVAWQHIQSDAYNEMNGSSIFLRNYFYLPIYRNILKMIKDTLNIVIFHFRRICIKLIDPNLTFLFSGYSKKCFIYSLAILLLFSILFGRNIIYFVENFASCTRYYTWMPKLSSEL